MLGFIYMDMFTHSSVRHAEWKPVSVTQECWESFSANALHPWAKSYCKKSAANQDELTKVQVLLVFRLLNLSLISSKKVNRLVFELKVIYLFLTEDSPNNVRICHYKNTLWFFKEEICFFSLKKNLTDYIWFGAVLLWSDVVSQTYSLYMSSSLNGAALHHSCSPDIQSK